MAMTCSSACCRQRAQSSKRQRRARASRPRRRRRALPVHMVKHIARPARRSGAAHARDADRPEAIDQHTGLAGFVVKPDAAFDEFLVALQHAGAARGSEAPGERRKRMRAKRTGSFIRARRSSTVAAPAEKICSAPSKSTGCSAYSARALGDRLGKRHASRGLATARGEFANGSELLAVAQAQVAHVAVESFHFHRLHARPAASDPRRTRQRPNPCARRASSRPHAATRPRPARSGSGSRRCARPDRRRVRAARPRPGPAG